MAIEINGTTGISGVDGSATTPALQGQDTNTGISFGTDEVNTVTGGSIRTKTDSSGRLLVGLTTGANRNLLQVQGDVDNGANGVGGISLRRGVALGSIGDGSQLGQLDFCMSDGGVAARIICDAEGSAGTGDYPGRLQFETTADGATAPTERLRITSDGTLQLRNSPGIDFSQIQTNATGMTNELLDGYEEGTWTPQPTFGGSSTGWSFTVHGHYVKVGKICTAIFGVQATTLGTATGTAEIRGFPFTGKEPTGTWRVVHPIGFANLTTTDGVMGQLFGTNLRLVEGRGAQHIMTHTAFTTTQLTLISSITYMVN